MLCRLSKVLPRKLSRACATISSDTNPLLRVPYLPKFRAIKAEHIVPAVELRVEEFERAIQNFATSTRSPKDDVNWIRRKLKDFERKCQALETVEGVVSHLLGVANASDLRTAHAQAQPLITRAQAKARQKKALLRFFSFVRNSQSWHSLSPAEQRIVLANQQAAEFAGVGHPAKSREQLRKIEEQLGQLETSFNNNVIDATKSFVAVVSDRQQLAGVQDSLIDHCKTETGSFELSLDPTVYLPVLQTCHDRTVRERLYHAYVRRASQIQATSDGESTDANANEATIARTLRLRQEKAKALKLDSFADLSIVRKMARSPGEVMAFLSELRDQSLPRARAEVESMEKYLRSQGSLCGGENIQPWDLPYASNGMLKAEYGVDDSVLQPYFPFDQVLKGLFSLCERLFGVSIRQATPAEMEGVHVWHDDVRYYVVTENKKRIATFFLDPFSRPAEKRGGAWMDVCRQRTDAVPVASTRKSGVYGGVQLPVAYLVCNQTRPSDGEPAYMRFSEVETLFHEFGHGLQHMLTRVAEGGASGISLVEWDAVELPSQFMENWCFHPPTLRAMSRHRDTGRSLPAGLIQRMRAARAHHAASAMVRQLYFSATDMLMHSIPLNGVAGMSFEGTPLPGDDSFECGFDPLAIQRLVASKYSVLQPIADDRFLCSFMHLFGNSSYAAGYYSYKWAEVLAADAFGAFEEPGSEAAGAAGKGCDLRSDAVRQAGSRFRETVLALGGSLHPTEVFRQFRGREPTSNALLHQYNLAQK